MSDTALLGSFAPKALRSFYIKIANARLTFLTLVFLDGWMGPDEHGRVAAMFGRGRFLAYFSVLDQHSQVLRRLATLYTDKDSNVAAWWIRTTI